LAPGVSGWDVNRGNTTSTTRFSAGEALGARKLLKDWGWRRGGRGRTGRRSRLVRKGVNGYEAESANLKRSERKKTSGTISRQEQAVKGRRGDNQKKVRRLRNESGLVPTPSQEVRRQHRAGKKGKN